MGEDRPGRDPRQPDSPARADEEESWKQPGMKKPELARVVSRIPARTWATPGRRGPAPGRCQGPAAPVRSVGRTAGQPTPVGPRPLHGADTCPADAALGSVPAEAESDADQAITAIYGTQYWSLVRLAVVLVGDVATAEEVVQDCFIAMCGAWSRLRAGGDQAAGALGSDLSHAYAADEAARGACAPVLPGSLGTAGGLGHGDQPRRGEMPHSPGQGRPADRPVAGKVRLHVGAAACSASIDE